MALRVRNGLHAGGKEIRTAGPSRRNGAFQNSILSTLVLAGRRSARLTHPPRARPQLASQEAAEDAGRGGLPKVERGAARIFRLAADQGDAAAQAKLGFFYQEGLGGLAKDRAGGRSPLRARCPPRGLSPSRVARIGSRPLGRSSDKMRCLVLSRPHSAPSCCRSGSTRPERTASPTS